MKHYEQIDFIKGIAALMVLINHSLNFVYQKEWVFQLSRCCVALFIISAGITLYFSFERFIQKGRSGIKDIAFHFIFRNILRLMLPYSIYVIIFYISINHRFNFMEILSKLLAFNINNPCYYFVIYIQLIIITPFMYYLAVKINSLGKSIGIIFSFSLIILLAIWGWANVKFTFVMEVFTAGKFLFGGTYLPLYGIGILIGHHLCDATQVERKKPVPVFPIIAPITVLWFLSLRIFPQTHDYLENQLIPGIGGNPPGLSIGIGSIILFAFLWSGYDLVKNKTLLRPISDLGKISLYIYLYHQVIKYIMLCIIRSFNLPSQSLWYAIPFYLSSSIGVYFAYQLYVFIRNDFKRVMSGRIRRLADNENYSDGSDKA